jgi:uncharacterized membrane protein
MGKRTNTVLSLLALIVLAVLTIASLPEHSVLRNIAEIAFFLLLCAFMFKGRLKNRFHS